MQVVIDPQAPMPPVTALELVEADTPLEALAKLARQGRLSPFDSFWARVVLSVDEDGTPQKVASVALTKELTMPHVE